MMIEEITLTDIQDFMVREVATSTEFADLATSLLGVTFKFYRGVDLRYEEYADPYFVSYKFHSQNPEGEDPTWFLQYIIGLPDPADTVSPAPDTDGVIVTPLTDHIEALAVKALGIIRQGLSSGGLNGQCNMRIADANILITEVGEADDVQAIVTLRFQAFNTL